MYSNERLDGRLVYTKKQNERVDKKKNQKPEARGGARLGLARNQLVCKEELVD